MGEILFRANCCDSLCSKIISKRGKLIIIPFLELFWVKILTQHHFLKTNFGYFQSALAFFEGNVSHYKKHRAQKQLKNTLLFSIYLAWLHFGRFVKGNRRLLKENRRSGHTVTNHLGDCLQLLLSVTPHGPGN